jgi:DnaJ-domain-containing protein 1
MAVRPSRLTEHDFDAAITKTPWALVRLDRNVRPFHRGLAEALDERWPGQFTFATVARRELRDPTFLDRTFQSAVGALRAGVSDGYWLLHAGIAVAHHGGVPRPANVSYAGEAGAEDLRSRIARVSGAHHDPHEVETVRQILEVIEPVVERRQKAAGFSDDGPAPRASWSPPPASPRRPPAADLDDPYVVLGLPETATNDEIRAAFKAQMKLNHPDKVAHLSPALQKFAEEQVLKIKDAYERLTKGRR